MLTRRRGIMKAALYLRLSIYLNVCVSLCISVYIYTHILRHTYRIPIIHLWFDRCVLLFSEGLWVLVRMSWTPNFQSFLGAWATLGQAVRIQREGL